MISARQLSEKVMKVDDKRKIETLQKTRLFGGLHPDELVPLLKKCREFLFESGELVFSAGDPSTGLFVVITGRTRALRHGSDGREQIIHEDGPAATFPEVAVFDDGPYPSSVVAIEESKLLFLPKEEVRRFCLDHPQVALAALRLLSTRLRRTTRMVEGLALRSVTQRIGEYLMSQADEQIVTGKPPPEFTLVHSNQEIADLVGTVREVVSRSFAKLQHYGWIDKTGRRVRILNRAALDGYSRGEDFD